MPDKKQQSNIKDLPLDENNPFSAVDTVSAQLATIEKFIARRFDEISMEINATAQQVDMAEEGIIQKFSDVLEVIAAISHKGDGSTPANAGVELDAVVDMTEEAANKILDAAGRINTLIHKDGIWEEESARKQALDVMNKDVEEIFMACSFQDITGQRIRKTLENLKVIEDRLGSALDKLGIHIQITDDTNAALPTNIAKNQDEIDALFNDTNE